MTGGSNVGSGAKAGEAASHWAGSYPGRAVIDVLAAAVGVLVGVMVEVFTIQQGAFWPLYLVPAAFTLFAAVIARWRLGSVARRVGVFGGGFLAVLMLSGMLP